MEEKEQWLHIWRNGILPNLDIEQLKYLKNAIENNSGELSQGATIKHSTKEEQDSYCALAYMQKIKHGNIINKNEKILEDFDLLINKSDEKIGEASIRHFLNFWDDTPKEKLYKTMLKELTFDIELKSKK